MIEVHKNLFVGNEIDCFYDDKHGWVVVHACKHPCHQRFVGYRGNLDRGHPNYLMSKKEKHIALNMVDMKRQLSNEFTKPIVLETLDFIEKNIQLKKVLIHCNHGLSRAPTLALLFLAKRGNVISNESYQKAREDFIKLFPNYRPGTGIQIYLTNYWSKLK